MWASVPWKYVRLISATEAIIQLVATAVTPNPVVDATHGELRSASALIVVVRSGPTRISRWRETNYLIPNPSFTPYRLS